MINQATVVGRLGKDPKAFEGKTKMVAFSVATDAGYGDRKQTIWEDVKVYGKQAEACEKFLTKGSLVFVSGRREESPGKDGKVFRSIVAETVKFLSTKAETKQERAAAGPSDIDDSDIPF